MRVWDLLDGLTVWVTSAHADAVRSVAVAAAPDVGPTIVSIGADRLARMWDLDTGQQVGHSLAAPADTLAVAIVSGRPAAIAVGRDRAIKLWDLASGQAILEPLTGNADRVAAVTVSTVDPMTVVSAGTDGRVLAWRLPAGAAGAPSVNAVRAVVCDGNKVWVAGADGSLCSLDAGTGAPHGPPLAAHDGPVRALATAVSDDGPVVLSGGQDGQLVAWSRISGQPVQRPWTVTGGPVLALAGDHRRSLAIVAAEHDSAEVWDVVARTRLCVLGRQHETTVTAVALVEGRAWAVTGSTRGEVSLWDLTVPRPTTLHRPAVTVGQHDGPVTALVAIASGARLHIASGAVDRTAMRTIVDAGRARRRTRRGPPGSDEVGRLIRVDGPGTAVAAQPPSVATPLACVAAGGVVRVWDAGRVIRIPIDEPVTALGLGAGAVVVGTDRGAVSIDPRPVGAPVHGFGLV